MHANNELKSSVENGTFDFYIESFKTKVFQTDVNRIVIKNIAWLSAVVYDKALRRRLKSQDVIRAVETFCMRLNDLQEEVLVSNYLTNMQVLLEYFRTVKDKNAVGKLAEFMTLTQHPLLAISGSQQINSYWSYLKLLSSCELVYTKNFAENIAKSVIQCTKCQEPYLTTVSYVEKVCRMIHYVTSKFLPMCQDDCETFCNFICSLFATLRNCKLKAYMLSQKSSEALLICLSFQAEISLKNKLYLPLLVMSSKSLNSIGSGTPSANIWNLVHEFYTGIAQENFNTTYTLLERLNTKEDLAAIILHHMFKVLYAHSNNVNYKNAEKKNVAHIQQIIFLYKSIIKQFQNVPNITCANCINELHTACKVHSHIVCIHYKLLERYNSEYNASLVSSYESYFETVKMIWSKNCPEKVYHSKLLFNDYIKLTSLLSKNDCMNISDKIVILEQFLKNYTNIYKYAKKASLSSDISNHFSQNISIAINLLTEYYLRSNEHKKAAFISCIGIYLANSSFRKYFNIKFDNMECKLMSSYDFLTTSSLTKGYSILMDNDDYVKLLIKELEASYKIWPSCSSMLAATHSIFKLTTDPLNLAKACVLLKFAKVSDDLAEFITKALDRLMASMKDFRGLELVTASTLLASLKYLKYLVEIEIYKKEISQGNSILPSAPEVPDRDGLVNANDTCNINPAAAQLNVKAEDSIMELVMDAYDLWNFVYENIGAIPETLSCYLEQALYHMENSAMSFAERGYETLKIDLLMLTYKFSVYLQKDLSTIKCMARLLTPMVQNDELEAMIKTTNDLVYTFLSDLGEEDINTKTVLCDYLLSYSEYLWNNHVYEKGFITLRYVAYLLRDSRICRVLLARVHLIRSLYRRSFWPSADHVRCEDTDACYELISAFEVLEECWKVNKLDVYYHFYSFGFFFNIIRNLGRYFLHIYQNRFAVYYLKMALKLSEKHAYSHQIGEILCILSRIDLRNQKTDQCQIKVMGLVDILYPSESIDKKASQLVCEEKLLNIKQVRNPRTQMFAENVRDGSVAAPISNKFSRIASVGSPSLCQRVHALPEFFHHHRTCKCICCRNLSIHRLVFEAINVQANLNSFLGNVNIAEEYFKNCKRIFNIIEERQYNAPKNCRFSSNINLKLYFQMSSAIYLHDYSIHLSRSQKHSQAMEAINTSIRIFKGVSIVDGVLFQDILSLKESYLFEMHCKKQSTLTIQKEDLELNLKLTPLKLQNALSYKTPACTKVAPKIQPKFVIHEDFSPISVTRPKIKFVLCDSDDEDSNESGETKSNRSHSSKSSDSDRSMYHTPQVKQTPRQIRKGKKCSTVKAAVKEENDLVFVSPQNFETKDQFYTPRQDNSIIASGGTNTLIRRVHNLKLSDEYNLKKGNIGAIPNSNSTRALEQGKKKQNNKIALNLENNINLPNEKIRTERTSSRHKSENDVFYTPMHDKTIKPTDTTKYSQKVVKNSKKVVGNVAKSSTSNLKKNIKMEPGTIKIEPSIIIKNEIDASTISNDIIESSLIESPPKAVRNDNIRKTRAALRQPPEFDPSEHLNDDPSEQKPRKNDLEIKSKPLTRTGKKKKNPFIL